MNIKKYLKKGIKKLKKLGKNSKSVEEEKKSEGGSVSSSGCIMGIDYKICTRKDGTKYARVTGVDDSFTTLVVPKIIEGVEVTVIGKNAFKGKTKLKEVLISESVRRINEGAFEGCTGIISVDLPDSVSTIKENAFYGCTSLVNLRIPKKIKVISSKAFAGCTSLEEVFIAKGDVKIAGDAFDKATAIHRVDKIRTYSNRVLLLSNLTGWTWKKAKSELDYYLSEYDYDSASYISDRVYRSSDEKLEKKIKKFQKKQEQEIKSIMMNTGWDRETTLDKLAYARKKFGLTTWKYSRYTFYANTDEEIKKRLSGWDKNSEKYSKKVMEKSGWDEKSAKYRIMKANYVYHFQPDYFVMYRFWEFQDDKIDTYARRSNSNRLYKKYNKKKECEILKNKDLFDARYKDYIKRKFWVNRDSSYEEFLEFIDGLEYIFCKPIDSGGGQGVEKIRIADYKPEKLYDYLTSKVKTLVEECVIQHPDIDAFVPGCVNTIRVITIMKDGKADIICASIRFGHNGFVDNFHQDGMCCAVDKETGIIATNAIDRMGVIYENHPIGGQKFIGYQIPNWDMVINCAKEAITCQEGVNYVGWDIAVCEDKAVIIEGNCAPDLVLIQAPYADKNLGQKYLFEPYF